MEWSQRLVARDMLPQQRFTHVLFMCSHFNTLSKTSAIFAPGKSETNMNIKSVSHYKRRRFFAGVCVFEYQEDPGNEVEQQLLMAHINCVQTKT